MKIGILGAGGIAGTAFAVSAETRAASGGGAGSWARSCTCFCGSEGETALLHGFALPDRRFARKDCGVEGGSRGCRNRRR